MTIRNGNPAIRALLAVVLLFSALLALSPFVYIYAYARSATEWFFMTSNCC